MNLRKLAESQLKCQQDAAAAEAIARQTVHVTEALATCQEWFNSVLKTQPDAIICTSRYDGYHGRDNVPVYNCRVDVEGMTFGWISNVKRWAEQYQEPKPVPGVRLVEPDPHYIDNPKASQDIKWRPVVTSYSYTGHLWATDLPTLALHLESVDRVRQKQATKRGQ